MWITTCKACDHEDKKESVSNITLSDSHKDTQTHTGFLLTQSLTWEDQMKSSNCSVMKIHYFILFLHQAQKLIPSLPPGFHTILRKAPAIHTHTLFSRPPFHCWQFLQTVISFYPLIVLMYFSGFLPQIPSHYSTEIATCSRKFHSFI